MVFVQTVLLSSLRTPTHTLNSDIQIANQVLPRGSGILIMRDCTCHGGVKSVFFKLQQSTVYIVSAAILLSSSQTAISSSPSVVLLDDQNFQHVVLDSRDPWMVNFFAYWDGHAKLFTPIWAQAAEELRDSGVRFGVYDWGGEKPESKRFAIKFGVWKYPHLMYFAPGRKKHPEDYSGGRQVEDIVEWVRGKTEQPTECSDGRTEL